MSLTLIPQQCFRESRMRFKTYIIFNVLKPSYMRFSPTKHRCTVVYTKQFFRNVMEYVVVRSFIIQEDCTKSHFP